MSFFDVNFSLFKKKIKSRDPGISRDDDQFCPVIPGYGKASEILNPTNHAIDWLDYYHFTAAPDNCEINTNDNLDWK